MSRAGWDYCPHCCVTHKIGEHPRDGESENEYNARMARLESAEAAEAGKPRTVLPPPYPSALDELIEAAEIRRDQWAAAAAGKLEDDDTFAELYEADEREACWQVERLNRAIGLAKLAKLEVPDV